MTEHLHPVDPSKLGHETSDVKPRPLVMFTVGLSALVAVAMVAMWLAFQFFNAQPVREGPPVSPLTAERVPPPRPRLQTMETQARDVRVERVAENEVLTTYGWVDKNAGVVRIPVDRALELTVQRGLPKK